MYGLVNRLTLAKPLDAEILRRMEDFLTRTRRENPGLVDARIISISDTVAIAVAFYTTREAPDDISSRVAAPWFAEHVRPYLAGPVDRQVGQVVAQLTT